MKIGSHVSLKAPHMLYGSVLEALSYDANALMVYTGAPQNTIRIPLSKMNINEALELKNKYDLEIIVHAPYIVNMASPDGEKRKFAISFLRQELERSEAFEAKYMVVHPGSYTDSSLEEGIENIIYCLNEILNDYHGNTMIVLETMAGKRTEVGFRFEQLKQIIDGVKYNLGVCFDTCHTHDSGYDLSNFDMVIQEFDRIIGIDYLKVFHINDSKNIMGAKKDRHENIGNGHIGFDVLHKIVHDERFMNVPKILETPYIDGLPPYKEEIKRLREK